MSPIGTVLIVLSTQSQTASHEAWRQVPDGVGAEAVNVHRVLGAHHLARPHMVKCVNLVLRQAGPIQTGTIVARGVELLDGLGACLVRGNGLEGVGAKFERLVKLRLCQFASGLIGGTLDDYGRG